MTAQIPASFLCHAHLHLRQIGRPFVYGRQGRDREMVALQNPASGRWALYAVPEPLPVGRFAIAELLMRFSECGRSAVEGLPSRFVCDGREVGRLDVCDGVAFVSDAVALSCLSFVLRRHEPRTGFFINIS